MVSPPRFGTITTAISLPVLFSNELNSLSSVCFCPVEMTAAKSFTKPLGVPGLVYAKARIGRTTRTVARAVFLILFKKIMFRIEPWARFPNLLPIQNTHARQNQKDGRRGSMGIASPARYNFGPNHCNAFAQLKCDSLCLQSAPYASEHFRLTSVPDSFR